MKNLLFWAISTSLAIGSGGGGDKATWRSVGGGGGNEATMDGKTEERLEPANQLQH